MKRKCPVTGHFRPLTNSRIFQMRDFNRQGITADIVNPWGEGSQAISIESHERHTVNALCQIELNVLFVKAPLNYLWIPDGPVQHRLYVQSAEPLWRQSLD